MTINLSSTEKFIHWEMLPNGICPGKDRAVSELAAFLADRPDQPATYVTQLATWIGNVDCPRCEAYLKANKERRERMRKGKHENSKSQEFTSN